ncbi:MAG: CPBP family intramembrane metalloprotease [Clostridia bacterium]|nr:CPBP family intramembrane metalloprotease [Clostridia bacterium]
MKNEKLMPFAAAFGWFGAYILLSLISARLPDGVDCAITVLALWGLVLICAGRFEEKKGFLEKLSHGGVRATAPIKLLIAFCAGAGLNLAFSGLLPLLPLPDNIVEAYTSASSVYEEPTNALMFKTVFLVPVLEETVFRGLIGDRLSRALPKWLALPFAALVFALMHGDILWISYAFLSGLILMSVYYRFNSILPCVSFHLAFNASNYLWEKLLKLPDDVYGYAASLAIGAVITVTSLVFLFYNKSHKE